MYELSSIDAFNSEIKEVDFINFKQIRLIIERDFHF